MNIKHHLDEATLVSYAAGSMSQAMALVVACHISMCPDCAARVREAEAIGGSLLDALEPAALDDSALDSLLAQLDMEPELNANADLIEQMPVTTVERQSDLPAPLSEYLDCSLDDIPWKMIVPGVYRHELPCKSERGGVSRLLRIAPGKAMLPHSHDGNELTLILRGSFTDEMGRFTVGDIADLDSDIEHQPLVDSDEDCICLIATDAPLKFSTLLGKVVQPITGF